MIHRAIKHNTRALFETQSWLRNLLADAMWQPAAGSRWGEHATADRRPRVVRLLRRVSARTFLAATCARTPRCPRDYRMCQRTARAITGKCTFYKFFFFFINFLIRRETEYIILHPIHSRLNINRNQYSDLGVQRIRAIQCKRIIINNTRAPDNIQHIVSTVDNNYYRCSDDIDLLKQTRFVDYYPR